MLAGFVALAPLAVLHAPFWTGAFALTGAKGFAAGSATLRPLATVAGRDAPFTGATLFAVGSASAGFPPLA